MFFSARSCQDDPPTAWLGIDMDWPLKARILGTIITYNCPFRTKTNLEELAGDFILFPEAAFLVVCDPSMNKL